MSISLRACAVVSVIFGIPVALADPPCVRTSFGSVRSVSDDGYVFVAREQQWGRNEVPGVNSSLPCGAATTSDWCVGSGNAFAVFARVSNGGFAGKLMQGTQGNGSTPASAIAFEPHSAHGSEEPPVILTSRNSQTPEQKSSGDTRWMKYATVGPKPMKEFALPSQNLFGLVFAVSPDGQKGLYSHLLHHGAIHLIDLDTGKPLRSMPAADVQCLAFTHSGETAVSGGSKGVLRLWSLSDGREIAHADGHGCYMRAATCSPTADRAASGGENGIILVWDLNEMKILRRLTGHTSGICHNGLVWSSDGKYILSGSWDGSIRLWNAETGEELVDLNAGYGRVVSIALSPDGKRALSSYLNGPDNPLILWDLENKRELHRFGVPGNVWHTSIPGRPSYDHQQLNVQSVAFSPDGETALFGIIFGSVILWDLDRWRQVALNRLHGKELAVVMYSADGNSSVSVGCDRDTVKEDVRVKVWRLPTNNVSSSEESD